MRDRPVIDAFIYCSGRELNARAVIISDRIGQDALFGVVEADERGVDIDHVPKFGMQPLEYVLQIEC